MRSMRWQPSTQNVNRKQSILKKDKVTLLKSKLLPHTSQKMWELSVWWWWSTFFSNVAIGILSLASDFFYEMYHSFVVISFPSSALNNILAINIYLQSIDFLFVQSALLSYRLDSFFALAYVVVAYPLHTNFHFTT